MKYLLITKCDTNDSDYITSEWEIEEERFQETLETIKRLLPILESQGYEWHNGANTTSRSPEYYENMYKDLMSADDMDFITGLLPWHEYGINRIESIEYCEYKPRTRIL